MQLPCGAAIILWGISPKEMGICIHTKLCTQTFTAALFTVAQARKRPDVLQQVNTGPSTMEASRGWRGASCRYSHVLGESPDTEAACKQPVPRDHRHPRSDS